MFRFETKFERFEFTGILIGPLAATRFRPLSFSMSWNRNIFTGTKLSSNPKISRFVDPHFSYKLLFYLHEFHAIYFFIVQRHGSMTTHDYVTQMDQFLLIKPLLLFYKRPFCSNHFELCNLMRIGHISPLGRKSTEQIFVFDVNIYSSILRLFKIDPVVSLLPATHQQYFILALSLPLRWLCVTFVLNILIALKELFFRSVT